MSCFMVRSGLIKLIWWKANDGKMSGSHLDFNIVDRTRMWRQCQTTFQLHYSLCEFRFWPAKKNMKSHYWRIKKICTGIYGRFLFPLLIDYYRSFITLFVVEWLGDKNMLKMVLKWALSTNFSFSYFPFLHFFFWHKNIRFHYLSTINNNFSVPVHFFEIFFIFFVVFFTFFAVG